MTDVWDLVAAGSHMEEFGGDCTIDSFSRNVLQADDTRHTGHGLWSCDDVGSSRGIKRQRVRWSLSCEDKGRGVCQAEGEVGTR